MKFFAASKFIPKFQNILLAVAAALLLVLSFPDIDIYVLAWVGFVPLIIAVYREQGSILRSFVLGWIFGTIYFVGTVWWLTHSPITYGGFPPWLAYSLLFAVCTYVGLFPAIFAGISAIFFKRLGSRAFFLLPFTWILTEFLRYWLSGNSWNAIGYSQAFGSFLLPLASIGGVYLVGFAVLCINSFIAMLTVSSERLLASDRTAPAFSATAVYIGIFIVPLLIGALLLSNAGEAAEAAGVDPANGSQTFVVVQVNVPMSGLTFEKWRRLRTRHVEMSEAALKELRENGDQNRVTVVFPESPMNFMYRDDREFATFINEFARRNNVNVLFNSAEPDPVTQRYFNSAVLVYGDGTEPGQYDKIYLVPFGEFVPGPLRAMVPGLIGSFASGREYDVFDINETKAAIMLCYESNFGQLSRRLVADGADYLIEMTNDGYLGKTPVLRQHLTSAVFRAVETNRPVLRATNVGITAYVTPTGDVLDEAPIYAEATRVWRVSRSAGDHTFYVRFGDWIAWLSLIVVIGASVFIFRQEENTATI